MANMIYSDPWGAYTRGQQMGAETAVGIGKAAREFRDSDRAADFMKWYRPLREREAAAEAARSEAITGQQQLGLNEGLGKFYGALSAAGPGAETPAMNFLKSQGVDTSQLSYQNYQDLLQHVGGATGQYPYSFVADPYTTMGGGSHYGARRLLPGEIAGLGGQPAEQAPGIQYTTPWATSAAAPSGSGGVQASPTPMFDATKSNIPAPKPFDNTSVQQDFGANPWK